MNRPGGGGPSILHVDMDAFYASVEVLEDPTLRGRPVVVGGTGDRGVVASCSYEARAFGVRSAMPTARARRLCPGAVFLQGRFHLYEDYSRRLHDVLGTFTPLVEAIGLDEAFLDTSGGRRLLGSGPQIGAAVRRRIAGELGLGASVGVATSKLVAKLASVAAKPRSSPAGPVPGLGVKVVPEGAELAFLHPLAVTALWGVGPATFRRLERFGVATVGDLAALPVATLVGALGAAAGHQLHELAWARDARPVSPGRAARSIGHEETFAADHHDHGGLRREVVRQSDAVASRLRRSGLAGRTVTLKVRFGDFRTITRSRTGPDPLDAGPELAEVALELLAGIDPSPGVRLVGVIASNLVARAAEKLTIGGGGARDVARAVDDVRRRFGDKAVGPASLLGGSGLEVRRRGAQAWGPAGKEGPDRVVDPSVLCEDGPERGPG